MQKLKSFLRSKRKCINNPLSQVRLEFLRSNKKELDSYKQYLAEAKSNQEELQRRRDWFVNKTDEVFQDFKGFDFKIGDTTLTFNPGEADKIKRCSIGY